MLVLIPLEKQINLNGLECFIPEHMLNNSVKDILFMVINSFNDDATFIKDVYSYIANTEIENELFETDSINAFELVLVFLYDNIRTQIIRQLGFVPKYISTADEITAPFNSIALTIDHE